MFDDGARNTHGVTLLKGILANRVRWHLAGDDDHRYAVHVGSRDTCDSVGHTGTRSDQRNTDIACRTGITISRMHCSLLVAHQDVLNNVLLVKSIVNMQYSTARITPDVLDTFGLERAHEDLRPTKVFGLRSRI